MAHVFEKEVDTEVGKDGFYERMVQDAYQVQRNKIDITVLKEQTLNIQKLLVDNSKAIDPAEMTSMVHMISQCLVDLEQAE